MAAMVLCSSSVLALQMSMHAMPRLSTSRASITFSSAAATTAPAGSFEQPLPGPFEQQLQEWKATYSRLAAEHYIPFASVQMGVGRFAADIVGQTTQQNVPFDATHALALGLTGLTLSGAGGALWMRHLEKTLGPNPVSGPDRYSMVLQKCAFDFVCWGSTVNAANLFLVPVLTGAGAEAGLENMVTGFVPLMLLELLIFGPYNLVGFSLIPPDLRPSVKAACSFVFSVCLSMSC